MCVSCESLSNCVTAKAECDAVSLVVVEVYVCESAVVVTEVVGGVVIMSASCEVSGALCKCVTSTPEYSDVACPMASDKDVGGSRLSCQVGYLSLFF